MTPPAIVTSRAASRPALVLVTLLLLAATAWAAPAPADADERWASPAEATIRPGSQLITTETGGQCTANFVFTSGDAVLIGSAAHCVATGAATDVDGCQAGTLPEGTQVEVEGAAHPATLAYSSWNAMQDADESDADACLFNDFALLELDPRDHDAVNPSVPHWGGPTTVSAGVGTGERVFSYGNSSLRAGLDLLKPKAGINVQQAGGGWTYQLYTITPGIPGDSGSAFLDADGAAMGVLSTLALAPLPASNGVSDLQRALDYARDAGFDAELVPGTEPFDPDQLPLGGLDALEFDLLSDGLLDTADDRPSLGLSAEISLFGRSFGFDL